MRRTGLILAGGESSRFGSPKPFAEFLGRPMVRWVADALAPEVDELLVSTRSREQARMASAVVPGARPVVDACPGRGPIEGFARGFEAARGDLVLVAPCDAPLLRPALYDLLVEALGRDEAAVTRVCAIDPLRGVYRRDAVRRGLADREPRCPAALTDLLRTVVVEAARLREADPGLRSFLDVNRPGDLRLAVLAALGRGAPRPARGVKAPPGASLHTVATEAY